MRFTINTEDNFITFITFKTEEISLFSLGLKDQPDKYFRNKLFYRKLINKYFLDWKEDKRHSLKNITKTIEMTLKKHETIM